MRAPMFRLGTNTTRRHKCFAPGCTYDAMGDCPLKLSNYPVRDPHSLTNVARPAVVHIPFTANFFLNAILTTIWGLTLTAVAVGKLALEFGTDGYIKYMTNWTWTVQMVYYDTVAILTWLAIIREIYSRYMHCAPAKDQALRIAYEFFYIFVLMLVTGVNFGVVIVLYFQPALIEENVPEFGLSKTLAGNYFVHVLPQIVILFHTLFARSILGQIFSRGPLGILWLVTTGALECLVFGTVYFCMFSPTIVYELPDFIVTLATGATFVACATTAVTCVVVALSPYGEVILPHPMHYPGIATSLAGNVLIPSDGCRQ